MEQRLEKKDFCWIAAEDNPCRRTTCPDYIRFKDANNCQHRLDKALTQTETARALGITRARVYQLEHTAMEKVRIGLLSTDITDFPLNTHPEVGFERYSIHAAIAMEG